MKIDFKPLYQCIHIYTALESLEELQRSYQADRKVRNSFADKYIIKLTAILQAQSDLILPFPLNLPALPSLLQEITGFFIIEREVLRTARNFRSERDVDELWTSVIGRLTQAIEQSLDRETDPDQFLLVKESLLSFITTLEVGA